MVSSRGVFLYIARMTSSKRRFPKKGYFPKPRRLIGCKVMIDVSQIKIWPIASEKKHNNDNAQAQTSEYINPDQYFSQSHRRMTASHE